jgi:N-succinyldiaminopimelate aminotransferase
VPPAWDLPRAELAAAMSPRTKLLVLNTPMNPSGKVLHRGRAWPRSPRS